MFAPPPVRLPHHFYDQAKRVVLKKAVAARENDSTLMIFLVSEITAYLKMYKRREIDAASREWQRMPTVRKKQLLAEQFAHSDWEALRLKEEDFRENRTIRESLA